MPRLFESVRSLLLRVLRCMLTGLCICLSLLPSCEIDIQTRFHPALIGLLKNACGFGVKPLSLTQTGPGPLHTCISNRLVLTNLIVLFQHLIFLSESLIFLPEDLIFLPEDLIFLSERCFSAH